jgi:uncharacterized protein (TIGR02271 family)
MSRRRNRKKQARRARQSPPSPRRTAPGANPIADTQTVRTIELRQEQLEARKQVVEAGLVQVRTEVQSNQQHLQVAVAREEVFVEREVVARYASPRPLGAAGILAEIPEYGEQVHLRTQPVVTSELTIQKHTVQKVRCVADTVLREELRTDEAATRSHHDNV